MHDCGNMTEDYTKTYILHLAFFIYTVVMKQSFENLLNVCVFYDFWQENITELEAATWALLRMRGTATCQREKDTPVRHQ